MKYTKEYYIAGTSEYIWYVTVIHNIFYISNVTLTEISISNTDMHGMLKNTDLLLDVLFRLISLTNLKQLKS